MMETTTTLTTDKLPRIEFDKQVSRDKVISKMFGLSPHHKRFEIFDNFPKILSQNRREKVSMDFEKQMGR